MGAEKFRRLPFLSLPPGGKVAPKGPDEGAGFGLHLLYAGEFRRLRAASFFPSDGKETKGSPGDGSGWTLRVHIRLSPGPPLRGLPLAVGRTFPARKIRSAWVRFLPGHWALGLWKIGVGAVPLLRLPFPNQRPEAVFRRRGAQCAPAGRSGTGPYAETDAFPDTPQGQVSPPARRRQRSSCRGGYQPPETARWGHRALQKSKHVFGYAAGTAPCGRPS